MSPGADLPQGPEHPERRSPEIQEIDRLILGHLDGELDDQGYARLEQYLAQGRTQQQRFLRMCHDHHALRLALARSVRSAPPPRSRPRAGRARPAATRLVLAVAALVVIGSGWWLVHRYDPSRGAAIASRPTALVQTQPLPADPGLPVLLHPTGGVAVTRARQELMLQEGMQLMRGDEVDTQGDGHAAFSYADGSVVELSEATRITVGAPSGSDPEHTGIYLTLVHGRLGAEFAHQEAARHACIATEESLTQVIGTRLAVERADSETCTTVTSGRVEVVQRRDQRSIAVEAGQCALIAQGLPCIAHAIGEPFGRHLMVGAGQAYASLLALPALSAGDEVDVMPGSYHGGIAFEASGTALRPIVIRGVGASPAVIDGADTVLTGVGSVPRALFQISGDHYRIEHLCFINARNQSNAAAIRTLGATTLEVEHCRISHCDDGIFTVQGSIDVGDCDVGWCGTVEHQALSHELYLGGTTAIIHGCCIHDALYGQAIKCASHYVELVSNRISDADDGEISFIDGDQTMQADSNLVLIGNVIISKKERSGNHQRFISIAAEGGGQRTGHVYLINNTFVARDARVVFLDVAQFSGELSAQRNIFFGSDLILQGQLRQVHAQDNWLPPASQAVGFTSVLPDPGSAPEADPGFLDALAGDFHLRATARAAHPRAGIMSYRDGLGLEHHVVTVMEPPAADLDGSSSIPASQPVIGAFSAMP